MSIVVGIRVFEYSSIRVLQSLQYCSIRVLQSLQCRSQSAILQWLQCCNVSFPFAQARRLCLKQTQLYSIMAKWQYNNSINTHSQVVYIIIITGWPMAFYFRRSESKRKGSLTSETLSQLGHHQLHSFVPLWVTNSGHTPLSDVSGWSWGYCDK